MGSTDLAAFRACFPALRHTHWLATPGVPPAATPVADAVRAAVDAWEDGSFSWLGWEAEADATRGLFARLVGVDPATLALATTLSEAASLVAASVRTGRVVVHEREFRSNLYPWLALAGRGIEVDAVPGPLTTDALCSRIVPGTTLVAVSAVQSATGVRVRLEQVAERCREVDARLFVNGTQALGALRLDLAAIRPDFLAAHGYKWLL
ncbi:MAG: aminotransferase class V-fold PLP-dependent enzyme, partial [Thermoleophilia bacterium]